MRPPRRRSPFGRPRGAVVLVRQDRVAPRRAEEALVGHLEALAKAGKKIPVDNRPVRGVSLGITLEVPATA